MGKGYTRQRESSFSKRKKGNKMTKPTPLKKQGGGREKAPIEETRSTFFPVGIHVVESSEPPFPTRPNIRVQMPDVPGRVSRITRQLNLLS
jgi:hypothetical protein